MKTAYCPRGHKELGSGSAGTEYGHVPGHQYHDVDVVISCIVTFDDADTSQGTRCHVCESWGSAQGCDEEHGRREVVAHGGTISEVVLDARQRAVRRGIEGLALEYLEEALSKAEDEALNSFVCTLIKEVPAGLKVRAECIFLLSDEDWDGADLPRPRDSEFFAVLEGLQELYNDRWEQDFKVAIAMAKATLAKAALEE